MNKTLIGALVAVIVVGGVSFYAGMNYAQSQAPASGARGQLSGGQFVGRGRGGGGFTAGQIITVGNGSIAIQSAMSSSTEIVLTSNSTQVFKTVAGSVGDLATGANVVVTGTPNSDGSLTAQSIQIRPAGTGGFGSRGVEGIIAAIRFAREQKIPYFGLCYGMQLMCVEYARNVAGLAGANTAEIDSHAPHTVIDLMPEQKEKIKRGEYGGTMRLGTYPCALKDGTIARTAYGAADIGERHRHRYEVNPAYIQKLQDAGLVFSGASPDGRLMEIAELPKEKHSFMLGTQFHPEFLSRPLAPHPLFMAFIKAAGEEK